jgi:hypothetical protein
MLVEAGPDGVTYLVTPERVYDPETGASVAFCGERRWAVKLGAWVGADQTLRLAVTGMQAGFVETWDMGISGPQTAPCLRSAAKTGDVGPTVDEGAQTGRAEVSDSRP